MRSRPILFSGSMVRALLDGSKCQTRRIVKPQPPDDCGGIEVGPYHPTIIRRGEDEPGPEVFGAYSSDGSWGVKCPHGQVGDELWVRETWRVCGGKEYEYQQDRSQVMYRATHQEDGFPLTWESYTWKPSIFMPRWASRITLDEITDVRVERLQDISEADAIAEGVKWFRSGAVECPGSPETPVQAYKQLWQSIHGPGSWAINPWVFVVSFTTISGAKNEL